MTDAWAKIPPNRQGVLYDGPGEKLRVDRAAGSTDREQMLVEGDVDEANADGGLGGEGRPECVDDAPGLGCSGRCGKFEGEGAGPASRKIADKGRRFDAKEERGAIEWKGLTGGGS
ncbi:hypothetical protein H4582DRAFT_2064044 [Lactarius indigo]|nr:hypothetical protein H4582DRAFT_2064044 [Lactarius indigo]